MWGWNGLRFLIQFPSSRNLLLYYSTARYYNSDSTNVFIVALKFNAIISLELFPLNITRHSASNTCSPAHKNGIKFKLFSVTPLFHFKNDEMMSLRHVVDRLFADMSNIITAIYIYHMVEMRLILQEHQSFDLGF